MVLALAMWPWPCMHQVGGSCLCTVPRLLALPTSLSRKCGNHTSFVRTPFPGDGLEFKVGGDGAIAGAKKALPVGTERK